MARSIEELPSLTVTFEEMNRDGPRILADMAVRHGPIFKREFSPPLPTGITRVVYLVGPEANRLVLHTHREHFSNAQGWTPILGPFFGRGLLNTDGPEWESHRKLMNPAFTAAYMARYLPVMNEIIEHRTADWIERGEVDLYEETREIAFDVAAAALVGLRPGPEADHLRRLFYDRLHPSFDPARDTREQMLTLMQQNEAELRSVLIPLVADRRAHPDANDDVLALLVTARDEAGLGIDDERLLAHVIILLVAGHETTTTLASWLLRLLSTHDEYRVRVREELDRVLGRVDLPTTLEQVRALKVLGNAVLEAGRLYSPVSLGPRGVVKEVEFGGFTLPVGTMVRYAIAAGHRLPSIFADPDRFDPDRFDPPREEDRNHPYALAIFGGGPRICIGSNMAQVEIKALAARVLRRCELTPLNAPTNVGAIISQPDAPMRVGVRARTAAALA
jgi:cytochrome P450